MQKLVIFDGNAIIHRAYHALPPMTARGGEMVQAVYGFASMYLRVLKDLAPTHVAVTFDMAGGTFRHEKFAAYKATRVKADQSLYDQIPLVHELVAAFGAPIFEKKGYEADDVIGTIVTAVKKQNLKLTAAKKTEVFVVTGDMDTLQLVGPDVKVYTLRKGINDVVVYDEKETQKRWGFLPNQMIDYKAIRGDTSDNIPGVPGIGEKGAVELLQKYGTLDGVYAEIEQHPTRAAEKIKPGMLAKLITGKESAYLSRSLATIECAVPRVDFSLDDAAVRPFDGQKIVPMLQKFQFVSLLKRIPGLAAVETATPKKSFSGKKKKDALIFVSITTAEEGQAVRQEIESAKSFSGKAFYSGSDIFSGKFGGVVLVVGARGYVVPEAVFESVATVFLDATITLFGHDLKPLIKILRVQKNVVVQNALFDTMIASYLLNPGSRAHDVASILLTEGGQALAGQAGQPSLFGFDARAAAEELYALRHVAEKLAGDLAKANNEGLFRKLEMPLIFVLAEMETAGIAVDEKKLGELSKYVAHELKKVSATIYEMAGQEFNIASPLQLREILFDKLAIPVAGIKKGKTGLSTSAEELQKMKGLHPIIEEIETFRELAKLDNTYISVLPALVNSVTHRIHTTYNQAVAATGRLSSTDPNIQNIPVRTTLGREIREAFVAGEGFTLVSADYSQIELRIVASLAKDKRMIEIFEAGEDIHTATAAAIHGVPLTEVTKDMRRSAKEINFGILYGMGTYGLAWRAEIPHADAKAFIEKYFREFSGVKKYIDETLAFTKKEGYCETLFGRRRYIPELASSNYQVRTAGERMAVNHPIQGTAADLMKMAMLAVHDALAASPMGATTKMILQVHDELVLEARPEDVVALQLLLKNEMERVVTLRVPVAVQVASGKSWGKMK